MNSTLKILLTNLVDYAGLFPPASLPLPDVVTNYRHYLDSETAWMLARLIIPAARLGELAETVHETAGVDSARPWRISGLLPDLAADDDRFARAVDAIETFNDTNSWAAVDTVETPITDLEQVTRILDRIPPTLALFAEIPSHDPDASLRALGTSARLSTYAKIRTGGVVADQIPATERVANFLVKCARHSLGLKFTAGLHHPIRADFPLTYESDAPRGTMHGFINVFLAAVLAFAKQGDSSEIETLLDETDPSQFAFTGEYITWRERQFSRQEVQQTRDQFAISFGSCSFGEPIADLIGLGWLESPAKTV